MRPGIVHRLDKDTSGVMIVAKNDLAHLSLAEQIKTHAAHRVYIALVHGQPPSQGRVEGPIGRHPVRRKEMAVVEWATHVCASAPVGTHDMYRSTSGFF